MAHLSLAAEGVLGRQGGAVYTHQDQYPTKQAVGILRPRCSLSYCIPLSINSFTTFDMSNDLPPCTGGYSAKVFKCCCISWPIG